MQLRNIVGCAALALLLGGCSTVDLNQGRYDPPPVRMPGQAAEAQPATQGTTVSTPVVNTPAPSYGDDPRVALMTDLTGASVVPPTASRGSGHIDMMFNRETGVLRWKTTWGGLEGTITGVQFCGPAGAGQTAPPVMSWPAPFGATYEGTTTPLSTQHANELLQGLWYVNVQTSAYPQGEIRGQLRVVTD